MNAERMSEVQNLISEAFADAEFAEEMSMVETAEEAQAKLAEKGISLTLDEIDEIPKMMSMVSAGEGELSEDELEDVAGGGTFQVAIQIAKIFARLGYEKGRRGG